MANLKDKIIERENKEQTKKEPKTKLRKIMQNILELNSVKKKFTKSNSFSYHIILSKNKSEEEKEITKNINKEKKKTISDDNLDNNSQNNPKQKYVRKNFMLKSEIFNLNRDINNYLTSVSKNIQKKNLKEEFDKKAKTHTGTENKNYSTINIQLTQFNKMEVNNFDFQNNLNNINYMPNNYQNYQGNNFQPLLYQNYPDSANPNLNQYYNYNKMNTQYQNQYYNNINRNNYVYLAKTQAGSKHLQEKILNDNDFINNILFPEIKNNLKEICMNIFGATTLAALLKKLSYENLNSFITLIKDDINDICLTEPGSHVIQSLIANILEYHLLLNKFIFYLNKKDIKKIFVSPYGNHVIRYYLSVVKTKEFTNFIYKFIYNNFLDIVKEKYGVCIIQSSLSEGDESTKKKIINLITENIEYIMQDQFGNYLIQYIFKKCININFELLLPIIIKIEEKILFYCQFKYSGSVLEKCFEQGDDKIREHFINFLLEKHSSDIIYIAANKFGFYVIKKAFNIKNFETKKLILKIIKKDINKLKSNSKEIKLVHSLLKEFQEYL